MPAMTLTQPDWARFLNPEGLAEKCGVPRAQFNQMILKELTDNALDTETPVEVIENDYNSVTVSDLGAGINLDAFDIKRPLVSSKHWRTAKRGALGNGLRAVMGALHCADGFLDVETRGVITRLRVAASGDVTREHLGSSDRMGTKITVDCADISEAVSFAEIALQFPGPSITKPRPSPFWFDLDAIVDLQRSAEGVTTADFCKQFHSRYKPGAGFVAEADPLQLLTFLRREAMADPKLIPIGDVIEGDYAKIATDRYIVEAWVTAKEDPQKTYNNTTFALMMNRTVALHSVDIDVREKGRVKFRSGGYHWTLPIAERDKLTLRQNVKFTFQIAITAPYVPIISSGKAPDLNMFAGDILRVVGKAGRKAQARIKRKAKTGVSIKDAVTALLPAAYEAVSDGGRYWANARQLMYEMRPDILRMCGIKSFSDRTITQGCIPEFLRDYPDLTADWRIAYDKRGSLVEPHSGTTVGLGTVEVADYTSERSRVLFDRPTRDVGLYGANPEDRFAGLLFVEKEGFSELITESGLLERYDLALASTKGMSVTAARGLIDEMAGRVSDFQVFIVTDFDITGQSIGYTLTHDTVRYQFRNEVNTIHLGVNWEQAQELHDAGRSEPVEGDHDKSRDLLLERGLDEDAVDFLTGEDGDPMRVEVNALRPAEFLEMLEDGLSEHCTEKLIPSDEVLADAYRELAVKKRLRELEAELRAADPPDVPDDLREIVSTSLDEDPDQSWDQAIVGELT